jgi:V/A-type H+-transporting ATPase subunit D
MRRMTVNPNRMELIRLRRRLVLARRGHKLLKDKQEELTRQYLTLFREARSLRRSLEPQIEAVYTFFGGARASMTRKEMIAALSFPRGSVGLEVDRLAVVGVRIPKFRLTSSPPRSTYGWLATSGNLDLALRQLGEILPRLFEVAEKEKAATLLADELQRTRQRVNALEHVLIPSIEETIRLITDYLAEEERSAITRLMKIKDIIRKQAEER